MADAAQRMAIDIGSNNQEACLNARVAYIESGTDKEGLALANRFGKMVYAALQALPSALSTPVRRVDPQLAEEIQALKMMSDDHIVIGGGANGAIIVSQSSEPVDFARILTNRIGNLVPVDDLEIPIRSVTAYTQTIGIYPDELKASCATASPSTALSASFRSDMQRECPTPGHMTVSSRCAGCANGSSRKHTIRSKRRFPRNPMPSSNLHDAGHNRQGV